MTDESRAAANDACRELRQLTRRMCIMASSDPPFSQGLIEQQLAAMHAAWLRIRVATLHSQDEEIRLPDLCRAYGGQVKLIAGISIHRCGPYQWAARTNTLLESITLDHKRADG